MIDQMHNGELYLPEEDELVEEQNKYLDLLYEFNHTRPSEIEKRNTIFKQIIPDQGKNNYFEPPFYANWGGQNVHLGDGVYANFNFTCVDDTHIYIDSDTMIGPNVTLATAGHPLDPKLREEKNQYNLPIHIGKNCWIGAGSVVVPGVSIGDNVVIGAGSVVTRDIPDNVIAYGVPCKVRTEITHGMKDHYKGNVR